MISAKRCPHLIHLLEKDFDSRIVDKYVPRYIVDEYGPNLSNDQFLFAVLDNRIHTVRCIMDRLNDNLILIMDSLRIAIRFKLDRIFKEIWDYEPIHKYIHTNNIKTLVATQAVDWGNLYALDLILEKTVPSIPMLFDVAIESNRPEVLSFLLKRHDPAGLGLINSAVIEGDQVSIDMLLLDPRIGYGDISSGIIAAVYNRDDDMSKS